MGTMDLVNAQFNPEGPLHDFSRVSNYENEERFGTFPSQLGATPQHLYIASQQRPTKDFALGAVQAEIPTYLYYTAYELPVYGTNTQIVSVPEQPVDGGTWGNLVSGQAGALGGLSNVHRTTADLWHGQSVPIGSVSGRAIQPAGVSSRMPGGSGVSGISPGTALGDSYSLQSRMQWAGTALTGTSPQTGVYTGVYTDESIG